jgi:5'-nucleotidase
MRRYFHKIHKMNLALTPNFILTLLSTLFLALFLFVPCWAGSALSKPALSKLALSKSTLSTPLSQATLTTPATTTAANKPITITILGINDFHGQVSTGRKTNSRPVGGASVLASYLKQGKPELAENTIVAFSGDLVGASPPASGLLNHEPSILFFNSLGNAYCQPSNRMEAKCNVVATLGNHEFDRGQKTMFDLINGANTPPKDKWFPIEIYPGASFPYISANIVNESTGKNLLAPYVIKNVNGVKIAFIGAITKDAPKVILSKKIQGIKFLDEAEAINHYVPEIKAKGADIIAVVIHEGGEQTPYQGATRQDTQVKGRITEIVKHLDDSIDLVLAGHTHSFVNAYLPNQHGKEILVTEAYSYSMGYAEVTLSVDSKNHTIVDKSARIITPYADQAPGNLPDVKSAKIIKFAEDSILPTVTAFLGTLQNDLYKKGNELGESSLGNLIADSFRIGLHADIGMVNPGGIRSDLLAGKVTWGNAYAVQPFSNVAGVLKLSGQDIYDLFEQQWTHEKTIILQISGLNYFYDLNKPLGQRIVAIFKDKQPLQRDKVYSIATNEFLAGGGDGFTVMQRGIFVPAEDADDTDLQIMVKHIKSLPQPFTSVIDGRISKI